MGKKVLVEKLLTLKPNRKSSIPGLNGPSGNLLGSAVGLAVHFSLGSEERGGGLKAANGPGLICPPKGWKSGWGVGGECDTLAGAQGTGKRRARGCSPLPPADGEAVLRVGADLRAFAWLGLGGSGNTLECSVSGSPVPWFPASGVNLWHPCSERTRLCPCGVFTASQVPWES